MKQSFYCLWVAVKIFVLTVFVLSNTLALVSFSEGGEWKMIIASAIFSFLKFSAWFVPLVPILFLLFLCGRKLRWPADSFFFYCMLATLSLSVCVFLFFSYTDSILYEGREGVLPAALFASGMAVFFQKGAIRRLATPSIFSEHSTIDDNSFNSTN
jgi:hypothetical protein